MRRNVYLWLIAVAASLLMACEKGNQGPVGPDPSTIVDGMPKSAKRGVAFSFTNMLDLPLLSPYISWDYNWGNTPTDDAALWFDSNEMDYCPMCWNGNYNADKIRAFVAAHPNTQYLLAFNEPNLTDQAHMTPREAAALWQPLVDLAKELNLKLVSPAMNYGTLPGYSDPIKWLDEFFALPEVDPNDIYAISIHCYMSSASAVQGYIERFEKYGKPIWLTEFCAWDPVPGSVSTQMDYMCTVLHDLETRPSVERYAWFIPRSGSKVDSPPYMQLITHDYPPALTDLGRIYCLLSPMNSKLWLRANRPVYASEYCALKNNALSLRPTTDEEVRNRIGKDGLQVANFSQGQELTYRLYLQEKASTVELRYCGYSNSICEVLVDGQTACHVEMPRTGGSDNWTAAHQALSMDAGAHTITLRLFSGSCSLSAFQVK